MVVGCEDVWREVSNYVDGELDPSLRVAMDAHIAGCRKCKAVLEGTGNIVELYGDERLYELPVGFSQRMRARLEENMPRQRGTAWGWMVAFAAAVLAVGTFAIANSAAVVQSALRSPHAQPGVHVPPEMMVVVADRGKTFHVQGCRFIHDKTVRSMPAEQAMKEGYTPCIRCMKKYLNATALWIPAPVLLDAHGLRGNHSAGE
jgi:anti-sigma factor RsiW